MRKTKKLGYWLFLASFFPVLGYSAHSNQHEDPVAFVIFWVSLVFFLALIGRCLAEKMKQPAVLGELVMGVIFGNLCYFFGSNLIIILREGSSIFTIMQELLAGVSLQKATSQVISNSYYAHQVAQALASKEGVNFMKAAYVLDIFSRYGLIFLLFKVGLETSVEELKHTGLVSLQVAIIGVIAPILLGFSVAYFLLPEANNKVHLFVAATLSATSIGITARVLSELKIMRTTEAKIILGAAMMDDILGLIILAVVSSLVVSGAVNVWLVLQVIMSSLLFFTAALLIGPWIIRKAVGWFRFLALWELKLFIALIFLMILAWLATRVQLSTIIGAFAAGLILQDDFFASSDQGNKPSQRIKTLIAPLEALLAPLFFILIGIQVKLEAFMDWGVLALASGLLIAAILGKLLSGLGAKAKEDRSLIGIGMLPRGEVGLVFASIGRTLGVMSDKLFTAIVLMVILTTFIAPLLLKARISLPFKKNGRMKPNRADILIDVRRALEEDVGGGDVSAALLADNLWADAKIISREPLVLCGIPWVEAVFTEVNPTIEIDWLKSEGEWVAQPGLLCDIRGPAAAILTAERSALNFLQTLSGTATQTHHYLAALRGSKTRLLDTRKTLPGLRRAQKYAVACAGGVNHRLGLYDAFLIKENHIKACGSISLALKQARSLCPALLVEVEVESLEQLREALEAKPDRILLDNFSQITLAEAVRINQSYGCELEASGGIDLENIAAIAQTGVDYISIGALTKSVRAVDLSLLFKSVSTNPKAAS